MASRSSGRCGRLAAAIASIVLVTAACGGSSPSQPIDAPPGTASPAASASESAAPTPAATPDATTATLAEMNALEAADVRAMREELGIAEAIGADGAAVLDAIEAEEQRFGAEVFAELPAALDIQLGPEGGRSVALAAFHPLALPHAAPEPGDLRQQVTSYLGLAAMVLPQADTTQTLPYERRNDSTSTVGSSVVDQTTGVRVEITTGGGQLSMTVQLEMTAKTTRDGAVQALVNSTGTGEVKINACPDEAGQVTGSVDFKLSQLSSAGGSTGTSDQNAHAAFTISVDGAARTSGLTIETTTSGGGTGGGSSWTAGGTSTFGGGQAPTSTSSGATDAQVGRVTGSAAYVVFIVAGIATQAEKFWRSGKCIDMNSSTESRTVSPKEQVEFTVEPRGTFDKRPNPAPVDATFSGKASLDPSGAGQPPPVSFRFKAGDRKDDRGTVELTQTSNRGIGHETITFTVGEADYRVKDYQGAQYIVNGTKCKGLAGPWELKLTVGGGTGTVTFTIPESLKQAPAKTRFKMDLAGASSTYRMTGSVVPGTEADGSPYLTFKLGSGTITTRNASGSITLPYTDPTTDHIPLESGSFCAT
jgi:hypothetical protein